MDNDNPLLKFRGTWKGKDFQNCLQGVKDRFMPYDENYNLNPEEIEWLIQTTEQQQEEIDLLNHSVTRLGIKRMKDEDKLQCKNEEQE